MGWSSPETLEPWVPEAPRKGASPYETIDRVHEGSDRDDAGHEEERLKKLVGKMCGRRVSRSLPPPVFFFDFHAYRRYNSS